MPIRTLVHVPVRTLFNIVPLCVFKLTLLKTSHTTLHKKKKKDQSRGTWRMDEGSGRGRDGGLRGLGGGCSNNIYIYINSYNPQQQW